MVNLAKFTADRSRIPIVDYDDAVACEILEGMSNGELLAEICGPKHMPLPATVRKWSIDVAEFGSKFSKAMEMQAHMLFEEGVLVARNAGDDENQTRNKNHIEACFKAAGKLLPKVYGDKADAATIIPIQIITNLGDGKGNVNVGHGVFTVSIPDDKELDG